MLTIEEILTLEADKAIEALKKRPTEPPNAAEIKKDYEVAGHKVMDPGERPNKSVKVDLPANDNPNHQNVGGGGTMTKIVNVVRVALALQKKIVRVAASFIFGIPVKYNATPSNEDEKTAHRAIGKTIRKNKMSSFDRKLARSIFAYKEAAEYWYAIEKPNKDYGFQAQHKLRVAMFSPKYGDALYPLFDEHGDLIAFSREYSVSENGKDVLFFETYTENAVIKWRKGEMTWEQVSVSQHDLGKIPIVYGYQEATEFEDVQGMIERLETILSNHGDTNDYHGSPKMAVRGRVIGFAQKGESGGIIEIDGEKGEAKYLSWDHAPESVRMEIENLLKLIHSLTQTPDISFETIKGLGALSGIALRLMFMDAHLKVIDKREIFDEYLERRISIIKTYLAKMNKKLATAFEELEIEPEITPFMIDDEAGNIDMLMTATGNKPVVSQKTAVRMSGLVADPDSEFAELEKQQEAERNVDIFEPTE